MHLTVVFGANIKQFLLG